MNKDTTMETLKLPFCHPVQGRVRFKQSNNGRTIKSLKISSNDNYEVEIPLKGIAPGLWNIIFEWEQRGEQFSLSRNVNIQ